MVAKLSNQSVGDQRRHILLDIKKNDIRPGIFQGLVVIRDNETHPISVRLTTMPMMTQSVLLTGIGILTSIILWEFIKYFRKNDNEEQRYQLTEKARLEFKKVTEYIDKHDELMRVGADMVTQVEYTTNEVDKIQGILNGTLQPSDNLARSNPEKFYSELQEELNSKRNKLAELRTKIIKYENEDEKIKAIESLHRVSLESNKQAATSKLQQVDNYKARSRRVASLWFKIAIAEFGSAFFGFSLGVFGLFTNDYILGLRDIQGLEILVLFGFGLGIGSLKEFVDR